MYATHLSHRHFCIFYNYIAETKYGVFFVFKILCLIYSYWDEVEWNNYYLLWAKIQIDRRTLTYEYEYMAVCYNIFLFFRFILISEKNMHIEWVAGETKTGSGSIIRRACICMLGCEMNDFLALRKWRGHVLYQSSQLPKNKLFICF